MRKADAKQELLRLLSVDGPVDQAQCRRLILRATNRLMDLDKASALADELGLLVAEVDMAEILGGERQFPIDRIMERLDDLEALDQSH
ncbi:hypothetical protein [Chelativorans sp. YIM 93263]|uniref:hypothetical protein n=1 Tax=Chelativorans sp. YIM 93263 TaxID=2906648 RepID=UPI002379B617|nr:hypothetical protein [Chelativorans sp. YIM 93263]